VNRQDRVAEAIARGNVTELLAIAEMPRCACQGPRDGEPFCPCQMSSQQVRANISLAALRRGRLLRLNAGRESGA
jgi:hypothetical protein